MAWIGLSLKYLAITCIVIGCYTSKTESNLTIKQRWITTRNTLTEKDTHFSWIIWTICRIYHYNWRLLSSFNHLFVKLTNWLTDRLFCQSKKKQKNTDPCFSWMKTNGSKSERFYSCLVTNFLVTLHCRFQFSCIDLSWRQI